MSAQQREWYVRDVKIPLLALLLVNVLNVVVSIPVILQLIVDSMCCVYVGCILGC